MQLAKLLHPWIPDIQSNLVISGIACDDRQVKPGFLFLAYQGTSVNGSLYIDKAIKNGASAIITDDETIINHNFAVPVFHLSALRQLISTIAARFYHEPSKNLSVIGVTGTNGKTTVAYLLMQAYNLLGEKSAYVGTLGMGNMHEMKETGLTTPGPIEIQQYCSSLKNQQVERLVMEVSSHSLEQSRVDAICFEQAIFTNITHDHLDYHGTFENYLQAKAKLFQFETLKSVLINADDAMCKSFVKACKAQTRVYTYGLKPSADIHVQSKKWTLNGMSLEVASPWGQISLNSSLLGEFNVYNILAVFGSLMANGFELNAVAEVIEQLQAAPGRMQVVSKQPLVIVDYAHTPDALEKVLSTLKQFKAKTRAGNLWVVFGCGGNRDPFKRPLMGNIAYQYADWMVVTSDNPRKEQPEQIISEIISQLPIDEDSSKVMTIVDRKLAIISCLEDAHEDDIVLIAGKGHEDYQIIGEEKIFFSDQYVVREFLNETHIN
jgi:UDP-N-acetylmuramoyl-L-alanyl-D-glutamate--2,6-diaminopimelate ligase